VGGAIGQGHINFDCSGIPSCSNSNTGFKLYGGYNFTPAIAGEVVYFDFGKSHASDNLGSELNLKASAVGLGVAFGGKFTPQWSGVARLGVADVRMKADATVGVLTGSRSESSTQAYAGVGVAYEVSKGLSITADIDVSRGKIASESGDLRLISVGLNKSF